MTDQLVDRYMHHTGATHGIYVVARPDMESRTDTADHRRAVFAALDRAAIEAKLAEQASELEQQGANVHVVHLDISYRRPT